MSELERQFECECSVDAAAYVLAALDEHEVGAFSDHMSTCAHCRAEVDMLQGPADALALAAPQLLAPVNLRARIMSTVHAEAELLKAAGHEADRPARARSRRLWRLVPAATAAGALAGRCDKSRQSRHSGPAKQKRAVPAGSRQSACASARANLRGLVAAEWQGGGSRANRGAFLGQHTRQRSDRHSRRSARCGQGACHRRATRGKPQAHPNSNNRSLGLEVRCGGQGCSPARLCPSWLPATGIQIERPPSPAPTAGGRSAQTA